MNKAARALAVLRDEGPRVFSLKLAADWGYRRLVLLERRLADAPPEVELDRRVDFAILSPDEVDAYCAFRPDAVRGRIAERLRDGHTCFVAREGGRVVAACWIATRAATIEYLQCTIALEPDVAYLFDAYTLAARRGRGIARALCMEQLRHLDRAGFRLAMRATAVQNAAALRMHLGCGFRPVGTLSRIRIGPWRTIRHHRRDPAPAPFAVSMAHR